MGLASHRRCRLSSNVRPHKTYRCGPSNYPNLLAAPWCCCNCGYPVLPAIRRCSEWLPRSSCCAKTVLHVVRQASAGTCPRRHTVRNCVTSLSPPERSCSCCMPRVQKPNHAFPSRPTCRHADLLSLLGGRLRPFSSRQPFTRGQAVPSNCPFTAVDLLLLLPVVGNTNAMGTMAWLRVCLLASAPAR